MKAFCTFALLLLAARCPLFSARTLDIYFLDADLGNAVLIVTPSGQALMFDTGQAPEKYVNRILAAMHDAGVKQLDYVIISHYHWDHYGTVAELSKRVPILNYVDHGPNVDLNRDPAHYEKYGGRTTDPQFNEYAQTVEKGHHIVARPGMKIPLKDVEIEILTSAGDQILNPLPGAGKPNPACSDVQLRADDESEDGQSVSKLLTYGKFRYADFGDLTWNKSYRLFCPLNLVGTVDAYLITHHGISLDLKATGVWEYARSSATPPEVHGLRPRVAILSSEEGYVGRVSGEEATKSVMSSPGLEDIWETHYQSQGGAKLNPQEQFVANMNMVNDKGYYLKLSAELDGSFTMMNMRNGFTKNYAARKEAK